MILDIESVKQELRVDIDDDDERILSIMDRAVSLVLEYIKVASDTYENEDEVNDFPNVIYAGIIGVIQSMYDKPEEDPLTPAVRSMLHRSRDPALA